MDVKNKTDQKRFVVEADGLTAYLEYERRDPYLVLIHTEVPPELEGRGIGSALARAGLEYARAHGLKVIVECDFVQSYLQRHPEYQDLIA